jgi:hypothetical protein
MRYCDPGAWCLATGKKLGRTRFAWDVPAGWAVPVRTGTTDLSNVPVRTGTAQPAGLSQLGLGCPTWLGCPSSAGLSHLVGLSQLDLGHVTSHVLTYADVTQVVRTRYTLVPSGTCRASGTPLKLWHYPSVAQGTPSYVARVCLCLLVSAWIRRSGGARSVASVFRAFSSPVRNRPQRRPAGR